ncbi:hypothetical protein Agabi119p4_2384 [Agaricus bisporus var. burnettii]|uniref:F-box domain-containing protein n=1 Tax=Agaricus bisporus var. burnettii TaxID=192524 RepID=A0A8H7F947_AGABI|nr:hypothetical protein Agabi119p4_2384 [Agaricus bisporus var. burnettii]
MQTTQIDSEVAILDADISRLSKRRTALLRQRNLLESPICRLPAELFSRIISLSIRDVWNDSERPSTLATMEDLFKLGSVCSHWYHATRSNTQFWNTFAIHHKEGGYRLTTTTPDYVSLLRYYYQRAGAAGLSVWMYNFHVESGREILDQIFHVILEENPGKLRSFHIFDDCLEFPRDRVHCLCPSLVEYAQREVEFTKLVELEFQWACLWAYEISPSPQILFRNSPFLRTFSLYIPSRTMIPTGLEFPWKHITTIQLCHADPEHALSFLSLHPHFTGFSFHLYFYNNQEQTWVPPPHVLFDMPLTTKFGWYIRCRDESSIYDPWYIRLFTHFRFPNLRHLEWRAHAPSNHPSTRDFFTSMQELEHLEFQPLQRSCISQYFGIFKKLKSLDVNLGLEVDLSRRWLKKLAITPGDGNLFPHLQVLNIISSSVDTPCSALIAILYSRRNGPIPWTTLEVDLDSLILPPNVGSSAEWEQRGRLIECSFRTTSYKAIPWASSAHYDALQNLVSQAKEVDWGLNTREIKLVFEN